MSGAREAGRDRTGVQHNGIGDLMKNFNAMRSELSVFDFDALIHNKKKLSERVKEFLLFYDLPMPGRSIGYVVGKLPVADYDIVVHYWQPKGFTNVALVAHGYYDHVGLYEHLVAYLLRQNIAVIAFDLPGHGLSSGSPASIISFNEYGIIVNDLLTTASQNTRLPDRFIGIGQSTGAAALLNAAHQSRLNTRLLKLILLAPLVKPYAWNKGRWTYELLRRFYSAVPREFATNSHDLEFLDFCEFGDPLQARILTVGWVSAMKRWLDGFENLEMPDIPVLILQGEKDRTVNWQYNVNAIREKFTDVDTYYMSEARHHLVNESESIRLRMWQLMTPFIQSE